jgi:hypothetical protein
MTDVGSAQTKIAGMTSRAIGVVLVVLAVAAALPLILPN